MCLKQQDLLVASGRDFSLTLSPSVKLRKLIADFSNLRTPHLVTKGYFDSSTYELWYRTLTGELHFEIRDNDVGEKHYRHPVVSWMNKVLDAANEK